MKLDLARAQQWMHAQGTVAGTACGWSVDSRTLAGGDVYFALRGPVHDGHQFVAQAFERGACCAVVDREVSADGPLLRVSDSLFALNELARQARIAWRGEVIGVTGSAGKTTTKDVIAHFLSVRHRVGKTIGNFNNHVGLPLSILRLPDDCKIAVLEMGMNHAGEIRELAGIAGPHVGVITNIGYAHTEFFRSIDGVAAAKRELIEALPASGTAILNADDERAVRFAAIHAGRSVTYGLSERADVRGEDVELLPGGARFRCLGATFTIPLAGRHGVRNVLAGIATAKVFGIRPAELVEAAASIPAGKMRGERLERAGLIILNDAYNANPEAMFSMLEVLAATPARRHIAVLGEMLELGPESERLHRSVGERAGGAKIDLLVGIRGAARAILEGARASGMSASAAFFFDDPAEAGVALRQIVQPGDAILFKGSRGVRVEQAIEKLLEAKG
jgi:UDP-N-acetylmuramoyl-tripeptide--D-alanyl-D-alanine ligase